MDNRVRATITTGTDAARMTSLDRLEELLEDLERYRPEPEGIVVELHPSALDELPPGWEAESVEED